MDFENLIVKRYSVRNYKQEIVSKEEVLKVLEAGRLAPSAANRQPWRFVVVDEEQVLAKIKTAYPRDWIAKAKQMIVICANHDEAWKRPQDNKDHSDVDASIAIDHMTLMAAEMGIGTCWVCYFDPAIVASAIGLPEGVEPIALLPFGYPVETSVPVKKRKAIEEIVSWNQFKQ